MNIAPLLLPIPLLALASGPAAQDWVTLQPATAPSARSVPALEAEGPGSVLLFGGFQSSSPFYLGDTWRWDGSNWSQLNPSTSPPPRIGADLVGSPFGNLMVLYGGVRPSGVGDTWGWDGTDWTMWDDGLAPGVHGPDAVTGTAMAFDIARGRFVLFGGASAAPARALQSETWELDFTTRTWSRITTASVPAARTEALMAYDFVRRECVLFGGKVSNGTTNVQVAETWTYDGTDWVQRFPHNSPCPHSGEDNIVFDELRGLVVLHAGNALSVETPPGSGTYVKCAPDETWEWDGRDWFLTHPSNLPRGAGQTGSIAWDRVQGGVLHFGGLLGSTALSDTSLYGGALPALATFGRGCQGTAGVPTLTPIPGALPSSASTLAMDVTGITTGAAAMLLGFGRNPNAPLDLAVIGAAGCSVYPDLGTLAPFSLPVQGGRATIGPLLVAGGTVIDIECVQLDPGANPLGITTSGAARLVVH